MERVEKIEDVARAFKMVKEELAKVIMGQESVIEDIITALFAGGHVLIEGIPGLGKTLLASCLSIIVGGEYKRVQFTPDLMPSDITGTTVYNSDTHDFSVKKGPLFTNLLLADEINRAPAKTQSALLQAMQEKSVTLDGTDYPLNDMFLCLATQNPIEMEGTYPLPEAQIDRFFMKILMDYPKREHEKALLQNYSKGFSADRLKEAGLKQIIDENDLKVIKAILNTIQVEDKIIDYILDLTGITRDYRGIEVGSSPRGSVDLLKASRVLAAIEERDFVIPDDVKKAAFPVLRHRMILDVEAELENRTTDDFLKRIIEKVPVPR